MLELYNKELEKSHARRNDLGRAGFLQLIWHIFGEDEVWPVMTVALWQAAVEVPGLVPHNMLIH